MSGIGILHSKIPNFRDIGNFYSHKYDKNIKKGILLRSPSLQIADKEDINILVNNNLKLVVDLRSNFEVEEEGNGIAQRFYDIDIITYKNLPLLSNSEWRNDPIGSKVGEDNPGYHYFKYLKSNPGTIINIFESIFEHSVLGNASIVHCAFGKDRTGVISALLQNLLGAEDKVIIESFTESHKHVDNLISYFSKSKTYKRDINSTDHSFMKPKRESVVGFLDLLSKEHENANNFLRSLSIEQSKIDHFVKSMVV